MTGTRTGRTGLTGIGAGLLAAALAAACAPVAARRQTDIMEKTGAVSVSAPVLRARVNDLAERLAGRIEEASDQVRSEASDPVVRRRALTAKIEVIPALYAAAYRADPLEGAMDVWAFAFQLHHFLDEGEGRDSFGQQQPLVREVASNVLADTDAVIRDITTGPEAFARARGRIESWAREHPIERHFTSRASISASVAEMRSERDAFVAVGAATDTIENLSGRLNTYAAQLLKQARWQAELLVADMAHEPSVAGALDDIHALGVASKRADAVMGELPGLMGPESPLRELLDAERRATLEDMSAQRKETLAYVTAERIATLEALRQERGWRSSTPRVERIEGLKAADGIKSRAVDSALSGLHELVDYTLWRVAVLMLVLMVSAVALAVLGYRLTIGRRAAG
jgi:hypothetical protein